MHSRSSSRVSVQQYPEVSVHDQLQAGVGSQIHTGTDYPGDTDETPTPTPLHQAQTHSADTTQQAHGEEAAGLALLYSGWLSA